MTVTPVGPPRPEARGREPPTNGEVPGPVGEGEDMGELPSPPLSPGAFTVPKGASDQDIRMAQGNHIAAEDGPDTLVCEAMDFKQKRHRLDAPGFEGQRISASVLGPGTVLADFDLEAEGLTPVQNREKNYGNAYCLVAKLHELGIDCNAADTGGRGDHVTIKIDRDRFASLVPQDLQGRAEKAGISVFGLFADRFLRDLLRKASIDPQAAGVDLAKNRRERGEGNILRVVGCRRPNGGTKNYYPKDAEGKVLMAKDYGSAPDYYFPPPLRSLDPGPLMPAFLQDLERHLEAEERDPGELPAEAVGREQIPCAAGMLRGGFEKGTRGDALFACAGIECLLGVPLEEAEVVMAQIAETCQGCDAELRDGVPSTVRSAYARPYKPCSRVRRIRPGLCDKRRCALHSKPTIALALSDLCSEHVGREVIVQVQVVGQKDQKALPAFYDIECRCCDASRRVLLRDEPFLIIQRMNRGKDFSSLVKARYGRICDHDEKDIRVYESEEMADLTMVYGRDLITEKRFTATKATVRELVVYGTKVPPVNKVQVRGRVAVNPKTNDLVIVASEVLPLKEDFEEYKPSEQDKEAFVEHFQNRRDAHLQIAPHITGKEREVGKLTVALVQHSVSEIPDINGRIIRGSLRALFLGDPRNAKSDTAQEGTDGPKARMGTVFGETVTAETATRTGLLYYIDHDKGLIVWGAFVLNDRGLLVADGLQAYDSRAMGEFREALAAQKVKVDRSQRGEAPIRVRVVACLNLRAGMRMSSYIFPCQAIPDSNPFKDHVDITRWDACITFDDREVGIDSIVDSVDRPRPMSDDVYHNHIMWVWSKGPGDVLYLPEAKEAIKEGAKMLYQRYSVPTIPIFNKEVRDTVTRFAVAYAALRHSTDQGHEKLIVTPDHVREAIEYMTVMADRLMLAEYKAFESDKLDLGASGLVTLLMGLDGEDIGIVNHAKSGWSKAADIADKTGLAEVTVKRRGGALVERGILVSGSKGYTLGSRGRQLVALLLKAGIPVSKDDTQTSVPEEGVSSSDIESHASSEAHFDGKLERPEARPSQLPGDVSIDTADPRYQTSDVLPPLQDRHPEVYLRDEMNPPGVPPKPSCPLPAVTPATSPSRPGVATPSGRSLEETVLLVKRTMAASFGTDWKRENLADVGRFLAFHFSGDTTKAVQFFKVACERGLLPYTITVDGMVLR